MNLLLNLRSNNIALSVFRAPRNELEKGYTIYLKGFRL